MATPTSISDLDGLFKVVYADEIVSLIPETAKLTKAIKFSEAERIGKAYHQPVALTYEHGYTYAAPGAGAYALRGSVSMKMGEAQVDGYQATLTAQMDNETAAKALAGGAKAFAKATSVQVENVMESATKRLELDFLYGQVGIGVADSSVNTDTTTTVIQLTTASWGTGIWLGMENAVLQFWKQSDGSLVSSGTDSKFSISSIDVANRKLTVTGTTTGISALDTALGLGDCDIYFDTARASASSWNQMAGLSKIITNTGTLFNINATTYNMWKGNTYDVGSAQLTFGKIMAGLAVAGGRGLAEDVTVYLNNRTWANVCNDMAALRRIDSSYSVSEGKNGYKSITFYGETGVVTLEPYNCVKEGEAYALPLRRLKRIGAQDLSFNSLGINGGKIFYELQDANGFEYRLYVNQSIFSPTPAKLLKFTNIVNS
jgi:hypothetical protein